MKLIKIKPRLVDHSLFAKPVRALKPVPKPVIKELHKKSGDLSFYYNLIAILVLGIVGFLLYQRYIRKDEENIKSQHAILTFDQYVREQTDKNV